MVDNIIPFSKTTWTKVTNSISKWISLCGAEANIATNLQNISVDSKMNILNDSAIGFYQRCYNKFSDKTRIEAAKKRLIRLQNVPQQLQQPDNQTNVGDLTLKAHQPKRLLRSTTVGIRSHKSHTVLPVICIICRTEKYIKQKHSAKRKRSKLSNCETNDNLLLSAATSKKR